MPPSIQTPEQSEWFPELIPNHLGPQQGVEGKAVSFSLHLAFLGGNLRHVLR